jgi:hypothetical protein
MLSLLVRQRSRQLTGILVINFNFSGYQPKEFTFTNTTNWSLGQSTVIYM